MAKDQHQISLTFPDGNARDFDAGVTPAAVAESISKSLSKKAISATVNGQHWDLQWPIDGDAQIAIHTMQDEAQANELVRHDLAHIMARAVQEIWPDTQVTIGPTVENGFYYDFENPEPFTQKDLKAIYKQMVKIINRKLPVIREEVSREEAERRIKEIDEPYKLEILEDIKEEPITIYHLGDEWWDLCAGPHLENTSELNPKAIELESVAGAYWRGDEKKAQLQRIYGTAWENPEQLAEYKRRKEEAMRRDHRKLGKELGLFIFSDLVGPGLPLWTPKGTLLRTLLEDFLKQEQLKRGYLPVVTPHIAKVDLFKTSGHWQEI